MSRIITDSTFWARQPSNVGIRINRRNPFTRNLISAITYVGGFYKDYANPARVITPTARAFGTNLQGKSSIPKGNGYLTVSPAIDITSKEWTIVHIADWSKGNWAFADYQMAVLHETGTYEAIISDKLFSGLGAFYAGSDWIYSPQILIQNYGLCVLCVTSILPASQAAMVNGGPVSTLAANNTQSISSLLGDPSQPLRYNGDSNLTLVFNRTFSSQEMREISANPWQVFSKPQKIWTVNAVTTTPVGGATDTLKAFNEAATGLAGAVGFAADTLKAFNSQSVGTITNAVTGFASSQLRKISNVATGITGAVGFAADTLQPFQEFSGGTNTSPPIVAPSQGGAPAWWGYEGFDGTNRPWWYRDLKDKARELERLRKLRIELGILPKQENVRIKKVVKETLEFVDDIESPQTRESADAYIARAEQLAERIEALVENIHEEDDEQVLTEMSRFFFHHKKVSKCQTVLQ